MKNFIWVLLLMTSFSYAQENREVEYIQKYALLAVGEMEEYHIPASITLAQGILETGGGQSRLAEKANNHFGIKCKKEWEGKTIYHDDDAIGECFRKYNSVKESFRDHSKFLAERPYYRRLFDLDKKDYKAWAHGLKKAGYATNPRYAHILISKIEKYNLHEFDALDKSQVYDKVVALYGPVSRTVVDPDFKETIIATRVNQPETTKANIQVKKVVKEDVPKAIANMDPQKKTMLVPVREINPRARIKRHPIGREYIDVLPGETLSSIAEKFNISVDRLMRYNELDSPEDLQAYQYLFFAKKKNKGAKKYHIVQQGETMYLIAQKNGIKLKQLYRKNRVKEGYQPKAGETLYLRGKRPRK